MAIAFNEVGTITGLNNPTSLQFGPDGRLYVSQQNGTIQAFTVALQDGQYVAVSSETLTLGAGETGLGVVKGIQNHNDDGSLNSNTNRQVTGLVVTEDSSGNVVLYISSSDPRISSNGDVNLDTNSGVITRVTQGTNGEWEAVDIVRGLPRSEENHSTNGLTLSADGTKLYVQNGGNTNNGAPSGFFSYTGEYALSGTLLEIDLVDIASRSILTDSDAGQGGTARSYVYDLPTLDDPSVPNDGVREDANGLDVNGPFGGNDGFNMAILPADAPLRIYADGFRNQYDVVLTEAGQLYTFDNGSNGGLGGNPLTGPDGQATNNPNNGGTGDPDALFLIEDGGYYGHPAPVRSNQDLSWTVFNNSGTADGTISPNTVSDLSALVPDSVNIADGFIIDPSKFTGDANRLLQSGVRVEKDSAQSLALATLGSSTNGLTEFTSTAFDGALQGALIAAQLSGSLTILNLNATGDGLDPIIDPGDDGILGTGDDFQLDADGVMNIATGLSSPLDVTIGPDGTVWVAEIGAGIKVFAPSDLVLPDDPDFDNDGILNVDDPFIRDATNGGLAVISAGNSLLWDFDANQDGNRPGPSGYGGGLTGVMVNGTTDFEVFFNTPTADPNDDPNVTNINNVKFITAANGGTTVVEQVSNGDPFATTNNGEYLFHTGVTVAPNVETLTIKWSTFNPGDAFTGTFQQIGGYIGTGDQANYLKIVAIQHGSGEIQVSLENNNAVTETFIQADDLFAVAETDFKKIFFQIDVDLATNMATPTVTYEVASGPDKVVVGSAIDLTGTNVLDAIKGDYQVQGQTTGLALGLFSTNNGEPVANTFQAIFDDIEISATGDTSETILYRVNAGGSEVAAIDGGPNWQADTAGANSQFLVDAGSNGTTGFAVTPGATVPTTTPAGVFLTERWDASGGTEMQWEFTVGTGTYEVRLYMGNGFSGTNDPGERVFDVAIEGMVPVNLDDVDLSADFGHQVGGMISNIVNVTDGTLDIDFLHGSIENPLINAIEIIQLGPTPVPEVTITGGDQVVSEGDGQVQISFATNVTVPAAESVDVTFEIVPNVFALPGAGAGNDYEYTSGSANFDGAVYTDTVTIAGSSSDVTVFIDILNDLDPEALESFTVNITGVSANALIGPTATSNVTIVDDDRATGPVVLAVNAGGPALTYDGIDFSADNTNPSPFFTPDGNIFVDSGSGGANGDQAVFDGTVFETERWLDPLTFSTPITAGTYDIELYFAEIFATSAGARKFNVIVEGQTIATDLDILAETNGDINQPVLLKVEGVDTAGAGSADSLDITFDATMDNAKVSAIVVREVPSELAQSLLTITPGGAISSSTFGNQSFTITNNGDVAINSFTLEIANSLIQGVAFDPDGTAGDTLAKGFTPEANDPVTATAGLSDPIGNGGFKTLTVTFDSPLLGGQSFDFGLDQDPISIEGLPASGPNASGSVSGAEQIGSLVTVNYANGVSQSAEVFTDTSAGGGMAVINNSIAAEVGIAIVGANSVMVDNNIVANIPNLNTDQMVTLTLTGTPGADVRLFIGESGGAGAPAPAPQLGDFEGNTLFQAGTVDAVIGGGGTVDVVVALPAPSVGVDGKSGIYYIAAAEIDGSGNATSLVSKTVVIKEGDPLSTPEDIDGDTILNTDDPFAFDGSNGDNDKLLPGQMILQDFNTDTADLFSSEAGFTGILVNQAFNPPGASESDPYGDRTTEATSFVEGGLLKITSSETDLFGTGTGTNNTIKDNYVRAADVTMTDSFSVEAVAINPFAGDVPAQFASFGITLGAGGTDDYVKFVYGGLGSTPRIQLAEENSLTGSMEENVTLASLGIVEEDVASIKFELIVDKVAGTLQGIATLLDDTDTEIDTITTSVRTIDPAGSLAAALAGQNPLTGGDGGIAYGVSITDWSGAPSFQGQWDYLKLNSLDEPPVLVGAATLGITELADNVQASNFGADTFQLSNVGEKAITMVQIDVTNALFPDSVFDPFGQAGDTTGKLLTIDTLGGTGLVLTGETNGSGDPVFGAGSVGSVYLGAGGSDGFEQLKLTFDLGTDGGFNPGETLGFSVDMDPNSIAGALKAILDTGADPAWDIGGISGAELIGSTFTVTFEDGTTATGQLQGTNTQAGAKGLATQATMNDTVDLTVNGLMPGEAGIYETGGPTVVVSGVAGQIARIVLAKGIIQPVTNEFLDGTPAQQAYGLILEAQLAALAGSPFPANNAAEIQTVDILLDGTQQDITGLFDFSQVPVYDLAVDEARVPLGFVASIIDPANNSLPLGPVTSPIYLTAQPIVSVDDSSASELDGNMTFTVKIDNVAPDDVIITYSTADDTATAGADYTAAVSQQVVIPQGQLSAEIMIPVLPDMEDDDGEMFSLIIESATIGTGGIELVTPGSEPVAIGTISEPDTLSTLTVNAGESGLGGTTFGNTAFVITNDSIGINIESITIDLQSSILPEMNFDPLGTAGDASGQNVSVNGASSAVGLVPAVGLSRFGNPSGAPDGYYSLTLEFTDFDPGEFLQFGVDVDPFNITGAGVTGDAGAVSGLELAGATYTVNYSDGTSFVSTLSAQPGTGSGALSVNDPDDTATAPVIDAVGVALTDGDGFVQGTAATIIVSGGTPGQTVQLIRVDGNFDSPVQDQMGDFFKANEAVAVEHLSAVLNASGEATFNVTLTDTQPGAGDADVSATGINHFQAVFLDADGEPGLVSNRIRLLSNDPPVANDDTNSVSEDGPAIAGNVLTDGAPDSDPDGDILSVVAVNGQAADVGTEITLPSGALLTLNANGSYTYDPNGAFDSLAGGVDGSDSFTYTVSDAKDGTDIGTVDITVNGVNDLPTVAVNIGSTTSEGGNDIVVVTELEASDPDHTASEITFTLTDAVDNGTLFIDLDSSTDLNNSETALGVGDSFTQADIDAGLLTYIHDGSETTSDSFTFDLSDPIGTGDTDQVFQFTINNDDNDPPVLLGDFMLEVAEGNSVALTLADLDEDDPDDDGDDLTYTVTNPVNGFVALSSAPAVQVNTFTQTQLAAGVVLFVHDGSETLNASFGVTLTDNGGANSGVPQTIIVDVTPVDDGGPTAFDDLFEVAEDATLAGNLTADNGNGADSDPDNDPLTITEINGVPFTVGVAIPLASGALLTVTNANGDFIYDPNGQFDPALGGSDIDGFSYTVEDPSGGSSQGDVTITVNPVDGDDVLIGTPFPDVLDGGAGNDAVFGLGDNDLLFGSIGNDRLVGGAGNDRLFGGPGNDLLFGGPGNDFLFGGPGADRLVGNGGNDRMFGGGGPDLLQGGSGNDIMHGEAGADILQGQGGNDRMFGGFGNDSGNGGTGTDTWFLAGNQNDYNIRKVGNQTLIRDTNGNNGNEGLDTLIGVERVVFNDGFITL